MCLSNRAKHFLTSHVLSSLVLMAPFLFWMIVFVQASGKFNYMVNCATTKVLLVGNCTV